MRIVSLLASGTEIVCALGHGEQLVGRSHECDHPAWVRRLPVCTAPAFDVKRSSGQIDAEVRRRVRAGEPLYYVDADKIDSLEPELLITQAHCEVCAVTPRDLERFEPQRFADKTLALNAATVSGIYDDIRNVATALGCPEDAKRLIGRMQGRIDRVRQAVAGRRRPSVVLLEWTDPPFPAANWAPELVDAAGGQLLLSDRDCDSAACSWSEVRRADPEWMIVAPCGFDLVRTRQEIPYLERRPEWFEVSAVRSGRVVLADGNRYFNRSGITVVDTAEILAEILHGYRRAAADGESAWERYRP